MKVAISGGSGMIGRALAALLRARGDEVLVLTRQWAKGPHELRFDASRGVHDPQRLAGVEALVNLTGAPIAMRPWTRARRQELWDSRVVATRALVSSLRRAGAPLRVVVGPSVLGRFGDRGDAWVGDDDPPGSGFLAELAVGWEEAHLEAAAMLGARGASLRMGVALHPHEQAFPLLLQSFRLGLGGWLGEGDQYTCWVSVRDAARAFAHVLDTDGLDGGLNLNTPEPVSMRAWVEALGAELGSPVAARAPAWALRGAFGEYADELLLASVRARSERLSASGFRFEHANARSAFRWLLAERAAASAPG